MTIQTSDSAIKLCLSQYMPADMTYVQAKDVVVNTGRLKRKNKRRVGYTADGFFSVEMYGPAAKVNRLLFMSLADTPPLMLARSLTAVRGVIDKVLPDWKEWDALVAELQQGKDVTIGPVKAHYQQLTDTVRVLFVQIG